MVILTVAKFATVLVAAASAIHFESDGNNGSDVDQHSVHNPNYPIAPVDSTVSVDHIPNPHYPAAPTDSTISIDHSECQAAVKKFQYKTGEQDSVVSIDHSEYQAAFKKFQPKTDEPTALLKIDLKKARLFYPQTPNPKVDDLNAARLVYPQTPNPKVDDLNAAQIFDPQTPNPKVDELVQHKGPRAGCPTGYACCSTTRKSIRPGFFEPRNACVSTEGLLAVLLERDTIDICDVFEAGTKTQTGVDACSDKPTLFDYDERLLDPWYVQGILQPEFDELARPTKEARIGVDEKWVKMIQDVVRVVRENCAERDQSRALKILNSKSFNGFKLPPWLLNDVRDAKSLAAVSGFVHMVLRKISADGDASHAIPVLEGILAKTNLPTRLLDVVRDARAKVVAQSTDTGKE